MKETLIFTAVHGDETFSIPVVEKLRQEFQFDWLVANPEAMELNVRYKEANLNRSGPGNPDSPLLEERLAVKLIAKGREYRQTIDIHGTIADSGVFLILGDPNWENIELAKRFDVQNVVLWPGLLPTGPLCQFIPRSLEIECGPKEAPETALELERVLRLFLSGEPPSVKQEFFIVTGTLSGVDPKTIKDFTETVIGNTTFYPLMVGQYPNQTCYMMQKLNTNLEVNQ